MNERAGIDRLARAVDEVAATLPERGLPVGRPRPARRSVARFALAASLVLVLALAGFAAWRAARAAHPPAPSDVRVVYLRINGRDASPRVWEPRRAGAVLVAPATPTDAAGPAHSRPAFATLVSPVEGVSP